MSGTVNLREYRTLLLTMDRGVATVTLNRPQRRNAVGDGMRDELADAYRTCDRDDDVRVIVLTGTPPAFCAGADLGAGERTFTEPGRGFSAAGIEVPAWSLSKPVIAAVNGHAIGLGLTLALQCDIRFFAADARYRVVQVRRGVVGDAYSHWILPRLVGIANAAEILLTGATFDVHRAVHLGLGSRALDAGDVLPAALASKRLLWDIHRHVMRHDDARKVCGLSPSGARPSGQANRGPRPATAQSDQLRVRVRGAWGAWGEGTRNPSGRGSDGR